MLAAALIALLSVTWRVGTPASRAGRVAILALLLVIAVSRLV